MDERIMNVLSNLIRVGIVDGIDPENGTVRVTFPDRDDMVVSDLALLSFEQNYPAIQDPVLCLFLPNGIQEGFCLGTYYNEQNPPKIKDENIYVKQLDDDVFIKYEKRSKKLTIESPGELVLTGNLTVNGQIRGRVVQ